MWEKTQEDGSRRLKCDAVPTIFCFSEEKSKRKPPKFRKMPTPVKINHTDTIEVETEPENQLCVEQSNSNESMLKKMIEYERHYKKALINVNKYKKRLHFITNKLKKDCENQNTQLLHSVFNKDQIKALEKKSTKFMKWSNVTVMKALKFKFSCGNNGYEEILKQKTPLPSLRTLRRRFQNLKFETGILHEVFKFLEVKIQTFKNHHEKDCVLIMDEMAITP